MSSVFAALWHFDTRFPGREPLSHEPLFRRCLYSASERRRSEKSVVERLGSLTFSWSTLRFLPDEPFGTSWPGIEDPWGSVSVSRRMSPSRNSCRVVGTRRTRFTSLGSNERVGPLLARPLAYRGPAGVCRCSQKILCQLPLAVPGGFEFHGGILAAPAQVPTPQKPSTS